MIYVAIVYRVKESRFSHKVVRYGFRHMLIEADTAQCALNVVFGVQHTGLRVLRDKEYVFMEDLASGNGVYITKKMEV